MWEKWEELEEETDPEIQTLADNIFNYIMFSTETAYHDDLEQSSECERSNRETGSGSIPAWSSQG